jgi:hypothetical protein
MRLFKKRRPKNFYEFLQGVKPEPDDILWERFAISQNV